MQAGRLLSLRRSSNAHEPTASLALNATMRRIPGGRFTIPGQALPITVKVITRTMRFDGTDIWSVTSGTVLTARPADGLLPLPAAPSFHYTPAHLDTVVGQLASSRRNMVEFRHRSWWREAVYDAFRRAGLLLQRATVRDELIQTADDVYIRFHGIATGTGMTTLPGNWRYGRRGSGSAIRPASWLISITTATRTPSRMPLRSSSSWTVCRFRADGSVPRAGPSTLELRRV
jgi:hypothetical protein